MEFRMEGERILKEDLFSSVRKEMISAWKVLFASEARQAVFPEGQGEVHFNLSSIREGLLKEGVRVPDSDYDLFHFIVKPVVHAILQGSI